MPNSAIGTKQQFDIPSFSHKIFTLSETILVPGKPRAKKMSSPDQVPASNTKRSMLLIIPPSRHSKQSEGLSRTSLDLASSTAAFPVIGRQQRYNGWGAEICLCFLHSTTSARPMSTNPVKPFVKKNVHNRSAISISLLGPNAISPYIVPQVSISTATGESSGRIAINLPQTGHRGASPVLEPSVGRKSVTAELSLTFGFFKTKKFIVHWESALSDQVDYSALAGIVRTPAGQHPGCR